MPELLAMLAAELRMASATEESPPRFDIVAYTGGSFRPDSPYLDAPMVIELAGVSSPDRIAALLDHDDEKIVGQTDRVRIGRSEITMSGTITGDTDGDEATNPATKVVQHAKRGFIWPVSLGASIQKMDFVQGGVSTTVNGRKVEGPVYIARQITLKSISFLSVAADQQASARIAAKAGDDRMNFHEWLKSVGFEAPSTLTEDQRTKLDAKFKEEQELKAKAKTPPPAPPTAPPPTPPAPPKRNTDDFAELKAKRARDDKIRELALKYGREYPAALDDIEAAQAKALEDESWTPADFENHLLRMSTRHERIDNAPKAGSSRTVAPEVIEVAMCRMGGMRDETLEKLYGEQTLEASHRKYRHGLSLRETLEMAAEANGFRGSFRTDIEDVLYHALPDRRHRRELAAAGPSTYDLADMLGNVLNRFVVDYFVGLDQAAMRMISATRPVRDFRQIESYSLTGDMTFKKVAPGGELKHGTLGKEKYTNQADTHGVILSIDRRDIINDDLGAFSRVGQRLGRGGGLTLLDVFWTAFINNATFFKAGFNNYAAGADTALSSDALTAAKTLFNKLNDPDGKPMNHIPRILLVPPELEGTGKAILNSQLIVMGGTAGSVTTKPNANIHAGTLDLAMARELSNSKYTGYSALKWYVLASPSEVPVIEICFLNGVDRPTVESARADFDVLGINMRAYFDFGVAMQEHRGGVGFKGEA
ncbi:MAG: Mu-like prophage major head subunit gpT family protein [Phycisphaerae bacterium]|nr:Mu-like prophage major head subunit gpT family protein [Phycisphaerae bacterium]